jgi:hypothetical protein
LKRRHIHLSATELETSIRFHTTLFGCKPSLQQADHAAWLLDDPPFSPANTRSAGLPDLDHPGLTVQSRHARHALTPGLTATPCCRPDEDADAVHDPQHIVWRALDDCGGTWTPTYGEVPICAPGSGCCAQP